MQTRLSKDKIKHDEVIESFRRDFLAIEDRGFIPSNRTHNTGIGKTFEDMIGVYENNNQLADYEDILELKSQREFSKSMISIFTLVPTYPKRIMTHIRDNYGTQDQEFSNRKIIHTTISHSKFNNYKGLYGFKLKLDTSEDKLFLIIKNLKTGKEENLKIYWNLTILKKIIKKKCRYIAYISAQVKKEKGIEHFHFTKATILSGLTFPKFLRLIQEGIIVFDIRFGVYRSGSKKGQSHDHGPAFRIQKRNLKKAFNIMEL